MIFSKNPLLALIQTLALIVAAFTVSSLSIASEIRHQTFNSSTLGRDYVYNIYLPDGYENSGLNYPVLYLLHGASDNEESWVGEGDIQQTTDALIFARAIKSLLIVMPADPNFWWADSHLEKARSALVADLMQEIAANFRTIEARDGCAIAGYSAGGFGSANLALNYPHLFSAAAPLSPAVYTPEPPASSSANRQNIFLSDGKFDAELFASLNWVSFIEEYKRKGIIVPFYINTGDHDQFDIAYHAAVFYQELRKHQPEQVEFRVFDGDHSFAAWGGSVGDAMQFMDGFLATPK